MNEKMDRWVDGFSKRKILCFLKFGRVNRIPLNLVELGPLGERNLYKDWI